MATSVFQTRGEVNHHDRSYPGEHAAITDAELFAAVQAKLSVGGAGGG